MQHIGRLALVAGAFAALTAPATLSAGMPKTAPPQKSSPLLLVSGMGRGGGGGFRGGGGFGGAALGAAVGGLLGAMANQPQQAPPPYYAPPPYQPQEAPPPYYAPPLPPPPPPQYVDQPPPGPPPGPYVSVPPLGTPVNIDNAPPRMRSPQRAAPPDDPATAWSDPSQIIPLLVPPSGGPAEPLLDQPPPGSPLARNPKLLQATLDSDSANLAASGWALAYTVANGLDWLGWGAQQLLTYVPGMTPVNTGLSAARGFGSNFGAAMADPNATWGQTFARGAGGATVSTITSLAVPGVGQGQVVSAINSTAVPTLQGVATNTAKRLISTGMGKLYGAAVKEANQQ